MSKKGVDAMRNYAWLMVFGMMMSAASASAQYPSMSPFALPQFPAPPSPPAWPTPPGAPYGPTPMAPPTAPMPLVAPPDPRLPTWQRPPELPPSYGSGPH